MTEKSGAGETKRRFFQRRVADTVIAVAALFVSAVSLWVGVRNELANEELVQGSTWPFAQIIINNADPDGHPDLQFEVMNSGVGPAKIESFELFWKGKPFPNGPALVQQCCGYRSVPAASTESAHHTPLLTGAVQGMVLRPGDVETFIRYRLSSDNASVWSALDKVRNQISYRICYCSVLDQCWRSTLRSDIGVRGQLHPTEVSECPIPAVPYLD